MQPSALTIAAIEPWCIDSRKIEDTGVISYMSPAEGSDKSLTKITTSDLFKTDVALLTGIIDSTKKISGGSVQAISTTDIVSSITKIDSVWSKIGDGMNYSYYYLKIDKDAMVKALTADKTAFAQYCL
jgi:hypothetical protein